MSDASSFINHLLARPDALDWRARAAAVARIANIEPPSRRQETWRTLRLNDLWSSRYQAAPPVHAARDASGLTIDAATIVFVSGRLDLARSQAALDSLATLGVDLHTFAAHGVPEHIGALADEAFAGDLFAALNAATLTDGLAIRAPKNAQITRPIHVLHIDDASAASAPRLHISVERGASLTVVEEHISADDSATFATSLVEVHVADAASLEHIKLQRLATNATHIARCVAHVGRDARYHSVTAHFGASLSRQDTLARIVGSGAEATLHGLAKLSGAQISDTHTIVQHAAPHTTSDQLHKCVVSDSSQAVFNGAINVLQHAQQIQAYQLNRNLLLSERARIDTKPQLEIFADDVKCTHGATIGQLDPEQLFYLQTRGVRVAQARELLTYAFAAEVLDKVSSPAIAAALRDELALRSAR
jgi:Fe-S cluster assembly protein SufD